MTKAEKIILDYTASCEWSQIEKLDWTTAEVIDVFDSYFKAQKTAHNSEYTEIAKCEGCVLAKPTIENCFCCFKGKLEGSNFV